LPGLRLATRPPAAQRLPQRSGRGRRLRGIQHGTDGVQLPGQASGPNLSIQAAGVCVVELLLQLLNLPLQALDPDLDEEVDESLEESDEQPKQDEVSAAAAPAATATEPPAWLNDLKTIQGRMSAIEARLKRTDDPAANEKLLRELRAESSKSTGLLEEALLALDETAYADPAVRERLQKAVTQRRDDEARNALRDEILADLKPRAQSPTDDYREREATKVWESTWADVIQDAGLDPDAPEFRPVWVGVSPFLSQNDIAGANAFMKSEVKKLRAEVQTATRRQNAKTAGGKTPQPAEPGEIGPMHESRSNAERMAHLRSIGAIS
jgi:hypothetical protein